MTVLLYLWSLPKAAPKNSSGDNRSGCYFIKSIDIRLQSSFVCRFRVRVPSSVEVLISVRVANYRGESFVQPFRKYWNKYSSREALFMFDRFFFEGISLLLIWINYGVHSVYLARTNDWIFVETDDAYRWMVINRIKMEGMYSINNELICLSIFVYIILCMYIFIYIYIQFPFDRMM